MIFYCPLIKDSESGELHQTEAEAIDELLAMGYDVTKLTRGGKGPLSPLYDVEQDICVSIISV
jgi:hypothetical protein